MAFSFASDFVDMFSRTRILYISGELGTGKTLLSFALADLLMSNGLVWGVWTNVNHSFPVRKQLTRTVFILDEGAEHMDARDSASEFQGYGLYLRKLNSYFIVPCVNAPDKRARQMEAYRIADLSFLDLWLYGYKSVNRKSSGWFMLTYPQDYFGKYDTRQIPDDDGGMSEAFNEIRPVKTVYKRNLRVIDGNNRQSRS